MLSDQSSEAAARIAEIDALQDEVLRRLEDLERRTAEVLAQYQGTTPDRCAQSATPTIAGRKAA